MLKLQMCQRHWDDMIHGINDRGLNEFCPHTTEDMMGRLKMQQKGDKSIYSHNPAMYANTVILVTTVQGKKDELLKLEQPTIKQKIFAKLGFKVKDRVICPVCYFYKDDFISTACDMAKAETERLVKLSEGVKQ